MSPTVKIATNIALSPTLKFALAADVEDFIVFLIFLLD